MIGLMQQQPLLISSILRLAARHHGRAEVVAREGDGALARSTYAETERRARRLADALLRLGVRPGDRVATLAWNTLRHFETLYAVTGIGAVFHPLNLRQPADELAAIATHAGDSVMVVEPSQLDLLHRMAPMLSATLRRVVVMEAGPAIPPLALPLGVEAVAYESLVADGDEGFAWPELDENAASGLCYTSGTTGPAKGVLFSHRSTVLHAMAMNGADVLGLRARDRIACMVQMFHVNAVSVPFAAPLAGAALLLPGRWLDSAHVLSLLNGERATVGWTVPTVWLTLLRHLDETGGRLTTLRRAVVGGSACPRVLAERLPREHGVEVQQSWGMTEASPLGVWNAPTAAHDGQDAQAALALTLKQGRALPGIDLRIVDAQGHELPWDGVSAGVLMIRGPWVVRRYFGMNPPEGAGADGWFDTGDIASIDADGFIELVDRAKDIIKSGGEWISSLALENAARAVAGVADVAAIAARHPVWIERPLLVVVPARACTPDLAALRAAMRGKVADWALPDGVVLVDALPLTGTGKVDKRALRARYADRLLPGA